MKGDFCFSPIAAERYGVGGAIVLHHLAFWLLRNQERNRNICEGKIWTYGSVREMATHFPFYTEYQLRNILQKLERDNAIITGRFNRMGGDRTKWYTLSAEAGRMHGLELPQYQDEVTEEVNVTTTKEKSNCADEQMGLLIPDKQYHMVNKSNPISLPQIVVPWEDEEFIALWSEWKQERKERRIKAYTPRGEQAALHKLYKETGGDVRMAMDAVRDSIANGWQGIFPKKGTTKGKRDISHNPDTLIDRASAWSKR